MLRLIRQPLNNSSTATPLVDMIIRDGFQKFSFISKCNLINHQQFSKETKLLLSYLTSKLIIHSFMQTLPLENIRTSCTVEDGGCQLNP